MTTTTVRLPESAAGSDLAYRMYRGLEDIDGMAAVVAGARTAAGMLQPVDVESMRHRYADLVNSDPARDCALATRAGETVGFGRVEWHDLVDGDRIYDLVVIIRPEARGDGIEGALTDWAEERAIGLAAGRPSDRRTWLAGYSYRGDAVMEAALVERRYVAVRWDAEMRRPNLEAIPEVPLPDGYEIRTPDEHELPAVFEMSVTAFADDWGQWESSEQRFEDWVGNPLFRRDLLVVAWHGDEPAAMVDNVLERPTAEGALGLLSGVCTHPRHRRRGLARAGIVESLRRLRDAGATSAYLNVDTDNENRAYALYESCGFRVASGGIYYRKPFPDSRGDR